MTVCASCEDPKIDGEPSIEFGSLDMSAVCVERSIDHELAGGKLTFASSASDQVATMPKKDGQAGRHTQAMHRRMCAAVVACNLESDNPDVQSNE
jgi:hypothetical protein